MFIIISQVSWDSLSILLAVPSGYYSPDFHLTALLWYFNNLEIKLISQDTLLTSFFQRKPADKRNKIFQKTLWKVFDMLMITIHSLGTMGMEMWPIQTDSCQRNILQSTVSLSVQEGTQWRRGLITDFATFVSYFFLNHSCSCKSHSKIE